MTITGIEPEHTPLIIKILPTLVLALIILTVILFVIYFKRAKRR